LGSDKIDLGKIASEIKEQAESAVMPETITVDHDGGQELYVRMPSFSEEKLRIVILIESIEAARKIYVTNQEHEREKAIWRRFFIGLLSVLLLASLVYGGVLICRGEITDFQLSILAGSILAEIFSILFFMVKYVHTDLYLKTFKTVTSKLLDYLVQDKGGKGGKNGE